MNLGILLLCANFEICVSSFCKIGHNCVVWIRLVSLEFYLFIYFFFVWRKGKKEKGFLAKHVKETIMVITLKSSVI